MSTYVSGNQPVGSERGTWVWLPLTPESNLATDFNNNNAESSPFTTPIETMNVNNSTTWVPADTPLFAPYPSSDMDAAAALFDQSLGLDVSDDLGPVLDTTNLFPTEAADADFAWMSQSFETGDLLELDPFLVAEIDRQVAEVPWDELLPASPLPDLAGLAAIDFPTAASSSIWAPITPSPSASGPSPPPGCASPSSSPAATATAGFACPEPSCTKAFPSLHQLRKHERKHTRPFVCGECHKGHAAKKDLHRHLWVRHPEVAERTGVPCEVRRCHVKGCDFEGRQDNLKRHLRTKHR